MRNKAVDTCPLYLILFLIDIRLKNCVEKVVSKDAFMLEYCLDRYKTQEMCDKEVDAFLSTLKFIVIGLLQLKRLKNLMIIYSAMII